MQAFVPRAHVHENCPEDDGKGVKMIFVKKKIRMFKLISDYFFISEKKRLCQSYLLKMTRVVSNGID